MAACDYCLSDYSDDGHSLDDEDCGPSRECFHVDLGGLDEGNHLGMPEDGDPPRPAPRVDILRELAVVPVPMGGQDTQLEQIPRCRPGSMRKQDNLCSSGRTSARSGQVEHQPKKRVIWPRTSSTASPTMPGQGCPRLPVGSARTWLQQQYYFERCWSHPPPRGGISRESSRISWRMPRSGGPKALPPEGKGTPEASRRDFPIHAGSLGPHRAHAGRNACSPGSLRQRAPPPQPSSPPRREGASKLPPQAWGTLRQRGGSEPLARTTRSTSFQPGHTTGVVPDPVPNPEYHHQVFGGNKVGTVAHELPTGLPAGWNGRW
jgi:hypothetical protein